MKFIYARRVYLPSSPHKHGRYIGNNMPLIWAVTDGVLGPLKIPVFDIDAYFKGKGAEKELFANCPYDTIHLTEKGNSVVAGGLVESFRELNWFPLPAGSGR